MLTKREGQEIGQWGLVSLFISFSDLIRYFGYYAGSLVVIDFNTRNEMIPPGQHRD